jgi:hypothetical protein
MDKMEYFVNIIDCRVPGEIMHGDESPAGMDEAYCASITACSAHRRYSNIL